MDFLTTICNRKQEHTEDDNGPGQVPTLSPMLLIERAALFLVLEIDHEDEQLLSSEGLINLR